MGFFREKLDKACITRLTAMALDDDDEMMAAIFARWRGARCKQTADRCDSWT